MAKTLHDMNNPHWFSWFFTHLDHTSVSLFGGTVVLGTIAQSTANEVTLFLAVMVGMSTMIYNVVKTRIAMRKEKDRQRREAENLPPLPDEDDD